MQIRIRGGFILRELYAGKKEMEEILDKIEGSYDDAQIKAGLDELELRIKGETEDWKSNVNGIDAIKSVLDFGRKDKDREDLDEVRN